MITKADVVWAMAQVRDEFSTAFAAAAAAASFYPTIATEVPATAPSVTYTGLGALPGMKLLRDRMEEEDLKGYKYVLKDDPYYDLIKIKADVLEDDGTGQYLARAKDLGSVVPSFYDQKVVELLSTGRTGVCYDGQPFYNGQHPVGVLNQPGAETTQSNLMTVPLTKDNLYAGIATMTAFVDDKGNPYGAQPNLLVVGGGLAGVAFDLLRKDQVGDTYLSGILTPTVSPYLGPNQWHLLDTRRRKPLILQRRTDIGVNGLETNDNLGSKDAWFDQEWKFGIKLRAAFGFGPWQTALGSFY